MYSSRLLGVIFLILAVSWGLAAAHGQPAAPAAKAPPATKAPPTAKKPPEAKPPTAPQSSEKAPQDKPQPTQPAAESKQSAEGTPAAENAKPAQVAVPWDETIESIVAKRYPDSVGDLRRIQQQVETVVKHARPAVVGVQVGDSVGSGIIINEEGLVLTAGHVASQPNRPVRFLFADGSRARGVTLGVNRSIDSGMMKITDKGPWPFCKTAPSDSLTNGDWVVGLGQPNGYFRDRAPPVRLGRVLYHDDSVVNTDVTLVGGDSGGPLFNLKGEVVGIHSRIGRRITSNFHVPISTYELTWDRLLAGEIWGGGIGAKEQVRNRPFLGVTCDPRGIPCRVSAVFPGLPADRAGVKPGDIITRYGESDISTFAELAKSVLKTRPGARVKLAVKRDGKELELEVRLSQVGRDYPGAPPLEDDE